MRLEPAARRDRCKPHPLPIHIMDSDIYAYAPAVLLGTVDKLALIGQSARTLIRVLACLDLPRGTIWILDGFVSPWLREQFRKGPEPLAVKGCFRSMRTARNCSFDPYPLLEIQDEAHLLDESLARFQGCLKQPFITLFAPWRRFWATKVKEGGVARPPRIVAASATVSEPSRQIDQIYQRQVVLFPQPGPDLYESFYARLCSARTAAIPCVTQATMQSIGRRLAGATFR